MKHYEFSPLYFHEIYVEHIFYTFKAPSLEATSCQLNVHFSLVKTLFVILKHTSFDFLCKIDASTLSQEDILGVTYDFFFGKSLLQNNN